MTWKSGKTANKNATWFYNGVRILVKGGMSQ